MATWNCNGSYKIDVGAFKDSFKGRDMVFYLETHQRPGQPLPSVKGYLWETACHPDTRSLHGSRRSGAVAVLFKEELKQFISRGAPLENYRYHVRSRGI